MTRRTKLIVGVGLLLAAVGLMYLAAWERHAWQPPNDEWWTGVTFYLTVFFMAYVGVMGLFGLIVSDKP